MFPCYGKLAHLKLDDLKMDTSDRVAINEYSKKTAANPVHFYLLSFYLVNVKSLLLY